MTYVSTVLIAKNEAGVIARAIKSVRKLGQVVVLDTGSSDGTMEVARKAGAEVYGPKVISPFHFADARNAAMDLASGEWVLSLDADEVLRDGAARKILDAVAKYPECDLFTLGFVQRRHKGAPPVAEKKERLFKRERFRWRYRVHELVYPVQPPARRRVLTEVVIDHFPETDKSVRSDQNLDLLKLSVQESPDHGYGWRELGMELAKRERWGEAVGPLERWLSTPDPMENPLMASHDMTVLGLALVRSGRLEDSMRWFDQASLAAPERREPLWHAGQALLKAGMPWEAINWLRRASAISVKKRPKFHLNDPVAWSKLCEESLRFCEETVARAKAEWAARQTAGEERPEETA